MYQFSNGIVSSVAPDRRFHINLPVALALIFVVSWIGAAPMVLASWADEGPVWQGLASSLAPFQPLMFFGTLLVTVFVTFVNYGFTGLKSLGGALVRFRVRGIWYFACLAGPFLLVIAGSLLARHFDPRLPVFSISPAMLVMVSQIFGVYLLLNTEEVAWRGYVLPHLQGRMSPLRANLILGVVWTVFHSPLFLMKGGHPAGYSFLVFAVMVMAITLIAGYIFNATRGSILISHLLHQSFNAWGEGLRVFPSMNGGSQWPFGMVVLILVLLAMVAGVSLARRRQ